MITVFLVFNDEREEIRRKGMSHSGQAITIMKADISLGNVRMEHQLQVVSKQMASWRESPHQE